MTTLGLDVGGTFLKAVVHDGAEVVLEHTERLPHHDDLDHVATTADRIAGAEGVHAVGVGLAGLVRWPAGTFEWGPHMIESSRPVRTEFESRLGLPVFVDNDANLAAYAEAIGGAAVGFRSVLMLMFGTGIGSGLVLDGSIYRGRSYAGEVGHMTIQPDGDRCACGRRGCWETLVSGEVLDRRARELVTHAPDGLVARMALDSPADAALLTHAASQGDDAAQAVLEEAGGWLGRGVANLILVLDPDVVVVGGAVAQAGRWLLDPARLAIASSMSGSAHRPPTPVVEARYGRFAGAVGAALLARDLAGGTIGVPVVAPDDRSTPQRGQEGHA